MNSRWRIEVRYAYYLLLTTAVTCSNIDHNNVLCYSRMSTGRKIGLMWRTHTYQVSTVYTWKSTQSRSLKAYIPGTWDETKRALIRTVHRNKPTNMQLEIQLVHEWASKFSSPSVGLCPVTLQRYHRSNHRTQKKHTQLSSKHHPQPWKPVA